MKKSEMEMHAAEYHRLMDIAATAERNGYFREAIHYAIQAWPYIDGMMQYERRYNEAEFYGIGAIDLVVTYAPLILGLKELEQLSELLAERKRIEKNTEENVTQKVQDARQRVYDNHKLWSYLETNPGTIQKQINKKLGGDKSRWDSVIDGWLKMGLVHRTMSDSDGQLFLRTRMGQVVKAKCPECGKISEAPKAIFLCETKCLDCHKDVLFVIVPD